MADGISKERFSSLELVRDYRSTKQKIKKLKSKAEGEEVPPEVAQKLEKLKAKREKLKQKLEDIVSDRDR